MPAARSRRRPRATVSNGCTRPIALLHMRGEFLHAEARAVDADRGQRLRERGVALPRIDLDRVLGDARAVEPARDPFVQRDQALGAEHRGRTAAPMDRRHALALRARGDEIDLLRQQFRIGIDRRVTAQALGGRESTSH